MERRMHPRPQFIRENWLLLDGEWRFAFDDQKQGLLEQWFKGIPDPTVINVPFTYETELSGINDHSQHQVVWYERNIELADKQNYVLTFEGADQTAHVWLNGQLLGSHTGAYERFCFDLSDYAAVGENKLVVRVADSLSNEQPRGKQTWQEGRFGCWYIGTTGIWKSVWLEQANPQRLDSVKMTPDLDNDCLVLEPSLHDASVAVEQPIYYFEAQITFADQLVSYHKGSLVHGMTPVKLDTRVRADSNWGTKKWSPHEPNLYDIKFKLYDQAGALLDEVTSYFGMRKIAIENGQVLLNNECLYQRLILDQGYWKESGITPPSVAALEEDIDRVVEMGYNGLRKHQKVEDERFMYLCDKKGVLVWAEMPSAYTFNDNTIQNLTVEWLQSVKQQYNHPCIITWVPFNESWGIKGIMNLKRPQAWTEGIYHLTKALDPNRPVITNDGWEHTISDILTLHDYEEFGAAFTKRYLNKDEIVNNQIMFNRDWFAFAEGYGYKGQPIIISEFGGIAFATDQKENWGYGNQVKDTAAFMKRFAAIHQAIQDLPYVSGYCYTQLTDVEQEVNGLLGTDRKPKVELQEIKAINERRVK